MESHRIFKIRPARAGDYPAVAGQAKMHLALAGGGFTRTARQKALDALFCERQLGRLDVRIAANIVDDNHILGWSVTYPPRIIYYVFVQEKFRHIGIGHLLISHIEVPTVGPIMREYLI